MHSNPIRILLTSKFISDQNQKPILFTEKEVWKEHTVLMKRIHFKLLNWSILSLSSHFILEGCISLFTFFFFLLKLSSCFVTCKIEVSSVFVLLVMLVSSGFSDYMGSKGQIKKICCLSSTSSFRFFFFFFSLWFPRNHSLLVLKLLSDVGFLSLVSCYTPFYSILLKCWACCFLHFLSPLTIAICPV